MQLPVKISYRGLEKSDQIDNLVFEKAARLEKFCDHINRCDIAIEQTVRFLQTFSTFFDASPSVLRKAARLTTWSAFVMSSVFVMSNVVRNGHLPGADLRPT